MEKGRTVLYQLVQDRYTTDDNGASRVCNLFSVSKYTAQDDQVIFWYRKNPKGAVCTGGTTSAPRNADFPADEVFALAMVTSDATITLDIGSSHAEFTAHGNQVSMGSVPFPVEDSQIPYIQILRNGAKVKDGYGSIFVEKTCTEYNFNPFVGVVV